MTWEKVITLGILAYALVTLGSIWFVEESLWATKQKIETELVNLGSEPWYDNNEDSTEGPG